MSVTNNQVVLIEKNRIVTAKLEHDQLLDEHYYLMNDEGESTLFKNVTLNAEPGFEPVLLKDGQIGLMQFRYDVKVTSPDFYKGFVEATFDPTRGENHQFCRSPIPVSIKRGISDSLLFRSESSTQLTANTFMLFTQVITSRFTIREPG